MLSVSILFCSEAQIKVIDDGCCNTLHAPYFPRLSVSLISFLFNATLDSI